MAALTDLDSRARLRERRRSPMVAGKPTPLTGAYVKRVLFGLLIAVGFVLSLIGIYSVAVTVISGALLGPRVVWLQLVAYLALGYLGLMLWRIGTRGWVALRPEVRDGVVVGPADWTGEGDQPIE